MPPASPPATFAWRISIEQRRLAVIDVAEHGYDRRARRKHLRPILFLLDRDFFAGLFDDRVEAEALRDLNRHVARDVLVDRRHRADLDELGDDVAHGNDHRGRKLLHGKQIGNLDRFERARRRGGGGLALLLALPLFVEQQLFLAIFLGGRLVLVRSGAVARATAGGRRRSVASDPRRDGPGRVARPATSVGRVRCRPGGGREQSGRAHRRAAGQHPCRLVRALPRRDAAQLQDGQVDRFSGREKPRPR